MSAIPQLPAPRLLNVQAVFRFATMGRGDAARDEALYEAVRPQFPLQLVRRSPAAELASLNPHIVVGGPTAQMSVGVAQADVAIQFPTDDPAQLIEFAGPILNAALNGLIAGGMEPVNLGVVSTLQTSTHALDGFSAPRYIVQHHMNVNTEDDRVSDVMARLNVSVGDTFYVGFQISAYEMRQLMRPVQPGVPMIVSAWEGEVNDSGIQLLIDVNNYLEARRVGTPPIVTNERLNATLTLSQIAVDALAENFISDATLPIDVLEGALNT